MISPYNFNFEAAFNTLFLSSSLSSFSIVRILAGVGQGDGLECLGAHELIFCVQNEQGYCAALTLISFFGQQTGMSIMATIFGTMGLVMLPLPVVLIWGDTIPLWALAPGFLAVVLLLCLLLWRWLRTRGEKRFADL